MAKDLNGSAVDADDYPEGDRGLFLDALRIDELRRALEGAKPPVLFSSVCARQVIEKLGLATALVIWVEQVPAPRLEQARRDFASDDNAGMARPSSRHQEVEAYIAAYDARMRPDVVVYLTARD